MRLHRTRPAPVELVSQAGRAKAVAYYDVNAEEYEAHQRTAKRRLNGLYLYNEMGKLVESWTFADDPAGSYFTRSVLTYDHNGRNTAVLVYLSAKTAPGHFFSISRSAKGVKVVPELADFPATVTIKEYDKTGNLLEERTNDAEGNLKEKFTSVYDAAGKRVKFRHVKGDGTIDDGFDSVYTDNGRSVENIFRPAATDGPCKSISRPDNSGRDILEEQYYCKPSDEPEKKPGLVITSRAIRTYAAGDISNLDWTFWNPKGEHSKNC